MNHRWEEEMKIKNIKPFNFPLNLSLKLPSICHIIMYVRNLFNPVMENYNI